MRALLAVLCAASLLGCATVTPKRTMSIEFLGDAEPMPGSKQLWVCGFPPGRGFTCITIEDFLNALPQKKPDHSQQATQVYTGQTQR